MFGVPQRGPEVDTLTEYLDDLIEPSANRDIQTIRLDAVKNIERSQARNELQYLKRSVPPRQYDEGEFVVIRNVDTTIRKNKKLIPKYRGPYKIHRVLPNDRYVIRDVDNCQITQIPYNGVLEAARLKPWINARDSIIAACYGDEVTVIDRGRSKGQNWPNVNVKQM